MLVALRFVEASMSSCCDSKNVEGPLVFPFQDHLVRWFNLLPDPDVLFKTSGSPVFHVFMVDSCTATITVRMPCLHNGGRSATGRSASAAVRKAAAFQWPLMKRRNRFAVHSMGGGHFVVTAQQFGPK